MVLSAEIVKDKGWEHFARFSFTILWEDFFKNQWDDENCQYFIFFHIPYIFDIKELSYFLQLTIYISNIRKRLCTIVATLPWIQLAMVVLILLILMPNILMNSKTNQIIDCHIDHVALAGNSVRMEKRGLTILLEKFRKIGIMIKSLTADQHIQVRSYLK